MGRRTQARRESGGKTLHGCANAPAHDDLDVLGENVGIGGHIRGEPVQQVPENRQGEVVDIAEACIRDFEVGAMGAHSMVDGVFMVSGVWNYMNGIAGLINLVTICGWTGIIISKDASEDMIWPDMMWFWIIADDLWNFAYVYNCVGDHSFYTGAALLISCTIPAFFIKKGGMAAASCAHFGAVDDVHDGRADVCDEFPVCGSGVTQSDGSLCGVGSGVGIECCCCSVPGVHNGDLEAPSTAR